VPPGGLQGAAQKPLRGVASAPGMARDDRAASAHDRRHDAAQPLPATQQSYVYAVAKLSRFFGRSPDQLGVEEVRAYQILLARRSLSWPRLNQVSCALRVLFGVTLGWQDVDCLPCPEDCRDSFGLLSGIESGHWHSLPIQICEHLLRIADGKGNPGPPISPPRQSGT
jgi:Phage integrase, N-terminal SAM-like domain